MDKLELYLFGQPRLEYAGKPIEFGLRKAIALIAYLVITKEQHSRDALATMLWPESDQRNARASLRRTLYRINKLVECDFLITRGDAVSVNTEAVIYTDVHAFQQIVEEQLTSTTIIAESETLSIPSLEHAVTLYSDDFLAGFSLADCHAFEEWRFFEAERFRGALVQLLESLITHYREKGEFDRSIEFGRRLLLLDPLDEQTHRTLMMLYASAGQYNAALRQYAECERIIREELGVEPQTDTTGVYEQIRQRREADSTYVKPARPQVNFVSCGNIHIAYQILGDGPIDIVFVCGYVSHLDLFWEEPGMSAFFQDLASFSRLILFDKRGVGLSERIGYPPTLEDTMDDILAVMDGARSEHAVLFGTTEGGPTSILFAATYPERVDGLILYGTCAKWSRSEDYPWMIRWDQYDIWLDRLIKDWGSPLNLENYAPSRANDPQLRDWWARCLRMASSPGGMKAQLEVMREIDVRDILPAIRAPTLTLHRKGDQAIRVDAGRHLARNIPAAQYIELEGIDHWPFVGDSKAVIKEMQRFVQNLENPLPFERMLATILILKTFQTEDCESSLENLGFIQSEITRYRGEVVSQDSGRLVARFDGPSRAINCAKSLVSMAQSRPVPLSASLHTGECELVAGEIRGAPIQITDTILQQASPYAVLVSNTVKDLVAGSGFTFTRQRSCCIEGIPGKWAVYSLEI